MKYTFKVPDLTGTEAELQRLRNGLRERSQLNARIASQSGDFTRAYVSKLERHNTAEYFEAQPTQHHPRAARAIENDSTASAAFLRIPRASGLGRAFHDIEIKPVKAQMLTIPWNKATYGKRVGEFPPKTFYKAPYKEGWALYFRKNNPTGRNDNELAFILSGGTYQFQDRTLLPSTKAWKTVWMGVTGLYIEELRKGGAQ